MDWITERGFEALRQGQSEIAAAQRLVYLSGSTPPAEQLARLALESLRSAMNWLEDTAHFETAHQALDNAGAFVRRAFGCELHRDGTRY